MDGGVLLDGLAVLVRELALFAAVGFLLLGASDLLVDLIWLGLKLKRLILRRAGPTLDSLLPPEKPGRFAIFIPAWQEAPVIGPMLRHALRAWPSGDYRLYVGCYPNDPDTVDAVKAVGDPPIRLVVGARPGPTTKACNLNTLYQAMLADEAAGGRFAAIILHDAEDVVHSAELTVFDRLIGRFDMIQLPVLPLIDRNSRLTAGSYVDEFAESHGREMVVREALGAGLPLAGVGCAIARDALAALAGPLDRPFDADSLTEDYEIGLRLHARGYRGTFVRLPAGPQGGVIATREHFPATFRDAVAQKSRWMTGIALSGWDRLGWQGGLAERWMRLRDRQAPLAALLLCIAYFVLLAMPLLDTTGYLAGHPVILFTPLLTALMLIAAALLAWRLALRFAFVAAGYGLFEGLRAVPRVIVSNAIAIMAARKALGRYASLRRGGDAEWGKTAHVFPEQVPAE